jgi:heme-degrading monooxygenase HmoA
VVPGNTEFVVVWEFWVRPGAEAAFEKAYGAEGAWVRLFSGDPAYRGTELMRDAKECRRFLTLDSWASAEAYESFKNGHLAEYAEIDRQCESLTEREVEIGRLEYGYDT